MRTTLRGCEEMGFRSGFQPDKCQAVRLETEPTFPLLHSLSPLARVARARKASRPMVFRNLVLYDPGVARRLAEQRTRRRTDLARHLAFPDHRQPSCRAGGVALTIWACS